jgi:hypothetical protein
MNGFQQLNKMYNERYSLYKNNSTTEFAEINLLFEYYAAFILWGIKTIEDKDFTEKNKRLLIKLGKRFVHVKNTFQQRFEKLKSIYFSNDSELNKKLNEIFEAELSLYGCALDEFQNEEYQQ